MGWPETATIERSRARWVSQSLVRRGMGGFRPDRPHAVVALLAEVCPVCSTQVETDVSRTDALFRHGGFGATLRVERARCPSCGYAARPSIAEERPPR